MFKMATAAISSLDGNEDSKLLNNPKAGVNWCQMR
jgi:hypothetical protein